MARSLAFVPRKHSVQCTKQMHSEMDYQKWVAHWHQRNKIRGPKEDETEFKNIEKWKMNWFKKICGYPFDLLESVQLQNRKQRTQSLDKKCGSQLWRMIFQVDWVFFYLWFSEAELNWYVFFDVLFYLPIFMEKMEANDKAKTEKKYIPRFYKHFTSIQGKIWQRYRNIIFNVVVSIWNKMNIS